MALYTLRLRVEIEALWLTCCILGIGGFLSDWRSWSCPVVLAIIDGNVARSMVITR